jgi:putative ubiquitin-RnfH superfamily antitoxin RatB of RatAB toxin-antitoxin module
MHSSVGQTTCTREQVSQLTGTVDVEVVFATLSKQVLIGLEVPAGATVAEVIAASGIERRFPDVPVRNLAVGIWGRLVERDRRIRPGDRVEIYRQLQIEPREARRQLARAGKTMGRSSGDANDPAIVSD